MTNDDHPVEVVITAPDPEWLRRFISDLVRQHLCSAGHLSHHETIYYWRGEVREGPEAKAILYTRASLVSKIAEQVKQEHPYEVPHVSATLLLNSGNLDYLQWVLAETSTN